MKALRWRWNAHPLEHGQRQCLGLLAANRAVPQQHLDDLLAHGESWVERTHGFLENHGEGIPAQGLHVGRGQPDQFAPVKPDRARRHPASRPDQAHDGQRGDTFAATRLAHNGQGFARFDRKTDAIDRGELAAVGDEAGAQVGDFKQRHAQARARQAAWNWSIWASMRLRSSSPAGRSRVARQAMKG